jgi:hypothetical protein
MINKEFAPQILPLSRRRDSGFHKNIFNGTNTRIDAAEALSKAGPSWAEKPARRCVNLLLTPLLSLTSNRNVDRSAFWFGGLSGSSSFEIGD